MERGRPGGSRDVLPPNATEDFLSRSVPHPAQMTETEVHAHTLDSTTGSRWLAPSEAVALTKEERIRRRWASHDSQWRRFTARVSSDLGRQPEDSLIMASAAFRAKQEELVLLED